MRQTRLQSRPSSTMATSTKNPRPKTRSRLPIPPLRQTLDRYLASLEPFFLEDEARGGMKADSARSLREKWAKEFETGIGKTLQERLVGPSLSYDSGQPSYLILFYSS